jgi:L-threonylcarbamoyladenylate synthase
MSGPRVVSPRPLDDVLRALSEGHAIAVPGDGGYQLAVAHADTEAHELLRSRGAPAGDEHVQIVVGQRTQAAALTIPWNKQTAHLTDRMWPGPLTVILPARVDGSVPAGTEDPVVRLIMPAWRPLRTLVRRSGPLAVMPLRRADGGPLVSAEEVRDQLSDVVHVVFVVDGGLRRGPTSTVVDCTQSPPRVQRVGALPESYVEAALLMGARKRTWFARRDPGDGLR